jgi:hypothetical protein
MFFENDEHLLNLGLGYQQSCGWWYSGGEDDLLDEGSCSDCNGSDLDSHSLFDPFWSIVTWLSWGGLASRSSAMQML